MTLGALTTYTEVRRNEILAREFPFCAAPPPKPAASPHKIAAHWAAILPTLRPLRIRRPRCWSTTRNSNWSPRVAQRWLPYHGFWTGYKQIGSATRRIDSPHSPAAHHTGLAALLSQSRNAPRAGHLESVLCGAARMDARPNRRRSHCSRQRRADGVLRAVETEKALRGEKPDAGSAARCAGRSCARNRADRRYSFDRTLSPPRGAESARGILRNVIC